MTPEFEKKLNERMERATLGELEPGFDKKMEWGKLSQKLQQSRKRRIVVMWSYAAAILTVILGSWFVMNEKNNVKPYETTVAVPPTPVQKNMPAVTTPAKEPVQEETMAREPVKKETPGAKSPALETVQAATVSRNKTMVSDTSAPIARNMLNEIKQYPISDTSLLFPTPQEPKTPIAVTRKHRQHAVSVLDIENEDRQFMITEAPAGTYANPILARIHAVMTQQDAIAGSDRYYPLQGIFKK